MRVGQLVPPQPFLRSYAQRGLNATRSSPHSNLVVQIPLGVRFVAAPRSFHATRIVAVGKRIPESTAVQRRAGDSHSTGLVAPRPTVLDALLPQACEIRHSDVTVTCQLAVLPR